MYDVRLSENEIKLVRWSLQVAADALALQSEGSIPPEDTLGFIANLEALDENLVSQVKPQRKDILGSSVNESPYQQVSFNFDIS